MIKFIKLLYDFSRPHTIIGSFLSITTLAVLVWQPAYIAKNAISFLLLLVAALACNVFITGLNQIVDVELDKINKPFLPIASGALPIQKAQLMVTVAGLLSLLFSFLLHPYYGGLIIIITLIGIAYSVPPIQLKKYHLPAAICITLVRGVLVNLGIGTFLFFYKTQQIAVPLILWPLTVFVSLFSIAIAWLKDVHDVEGDKTFNIKTFAVLYSKKTAYWGGNLLVLCAIVFGALYFFWQQQISNRLFFVGAHILLLGAYLLLLKVSSIASNQSINRFYMRFWVFFFGVYLIYAFYGFCLQ
jgi:homogentisate phytyltransferase / homogentisate geranylgeranyltransferase